MVGWLEFNVLFNTNTAMSKTKGQRLVGWWRIILLHSEGRLPPPSPQPFYGHFSGTTRVSRCQKSCKGRLTEAGTPTIRLGATPSGPTSAHLYHPHFLQTGRPSCRPTNSDKALMATNIERKQREVKEG